MAGWDTSGGFETETHEPGFGRACCEACGSLSFSSEYQQAFGVVVCVHCLRDTHYQLIPKGTAKELFLLSDGDLKRLGCITKANPQHKQWSGMKLYLKLQVAEVAQRKHGGAQSLQEARHSRLQVSGQSSQAREGEGQASEVNTGILVRVNQMIQPRSGAVRCSASFFLP
ncbi:hypothetical protein V8C86DRAFT_2646054 [Haematococcus lacustris]